MSTTVQLRIAARIHHLLRQQLGEGINVAAMLGDANEAREVLFVCQASGNAELVLLARQFVTASELVAAKPPALQQAQGDAPQDAVWARNTSGFGVVHLVPEVPALLPVATASAPASSERSWRKGWLRRTAR